jgi:proteic killer suppression protein
MNISDSIKKNRKNVRSVKLKAAIMNGNCGSDKLIELTRYGGLHYEHLHGDKEGISSVRVNDKYRIEFREIIEDGKTIAEIVSITELSNHYKK